MEGFWSLYARGYVPIEASLQKFTLVLGFSEFAHNAKKARKSLAECLVETLHLAPCNPYSAFILNLEQSVLTFRPNYRECTQQ